MPEPFKQAIFKYFETLDLYTNAIVNAHGKNHPETLEVRKLFEKVKNADRNNHYLDNEFTQLRKVTDNYAIPDDVCETYEATYQMLAEVERAYYLSIELKINRKRRNLE